MFESAAPGSLDCPPGRLLRQKGDAPGAFFDRGWWNARCFLPRPHRLECDSIRSGLAGPERRSASSQP
jgi:hypothetical protein